MKKFLSLLLVMAMFATMIVSVGALYGGVRFEGVKKLELGVPVNYHFGESHYHLYKFTLEKPTKLKIEFIFNRYGSPAESLLTADNLTYSVCGDWIEDFLHGGSKETWNINSPGIETGSSFGGGTFYEHKNVYPRSHYIGSDPDSLYYKGSYLVDYYDRDADLLPAGTYYLRIENDDAWADERDTYTVTIDCIHESTTEKVVTEPTCSKAGKKEIICDGCGKVADTETIKKLSHTPADEWVITDATCAKVGKKELFCTVCNEVAQEEKIDKLPCTFGEWTIDKETSCKAAGEKSRVCSVCGEKEKEKIDALPHTFGEWVIGKEPTCSATGERTRVCSVCQYKEKEQLEKLAHTFGEWEITSAPTCSSSGKQKHTCTVCSKSETENIPTLEHEFGKWEETTKATCTKDGKETRKCKNCSKTETRVVEKLNHYCDDWDVLTKATCTSVGKQRGDCIVCDQRITEEIPMLDHNYGEWEIVTAPTCSKAGKQSATCKDCGKTTTKTISKLDHDYGDWEITTEPTCTKEGKQTRKCTSCSKAETKSVEKVPHTVEEWTIISEATKNSKGTRKGKCVVCGKSVSEKYEKYPGREGFKKSREYGSRFSDVGKDKWFHEYVQTAYEYELANGTSDTKFSPDSKFTVAQALTAAANIHSAYYDGEVGKAASGEAWYTPYVNYCIENGIIEEGQFKDYNKNIKRGEMAQVFASVLPAEEYKSVRSGAPSDMKADMKSYNAVVKLYSAGIVSGDAGKGTYRPDDEIVRSEACVIFTRIAVDTYRAK